MPRMGAATSQPVFISGPTGLLVRCSNSACRAERRLGINNLPTEAAVKYANRAGWLIDKKGTTATCPSCLPRTGISMAPLKNGQISEIAMAQAAEAPVGTGHAIRGMRTVFTLLDQHLKVRNPGTAKADAIYASGWSDDRVAKESGMSVDHVRKTRIEAYAELADTETEKLAKDLADIKGLVLDLEHRIETLRSKRTV